MNRHSLSFWDGKSYKENGERLLVNTFDDWQLIPSSRPTFVPPKPKTRFVDIPGSNGSLDFTEALTKYPVYNDREGTFEFVILQNGDMGVDVYDEWYEKYSKIMEYLNGIDYFCATEDDPAWYYRGRFYINDMKSNRDWSTISIGYRVGPYKVAIGTTLDNWLWDPFNFRTGIIYSGLFGNLTVESNTTWTTFVFFANSTGTMPVVPTITVNTSAAAGGTGNGMDIVYSSTNLGALTSRHYADGNHKDSDFIIYNAKNGTTTFQIRGKGKISFNFRPGRF